VSAITSGVVPDLFQNSPAEILALYAWDDKLVDVSDVVETQRANYTASALSSVHCYNATAKERSFYGVPYLQAGLLNHIWRPLIEKAGAKIEDIPKTWDARYDFFKATDGGQLAPNYGSYFGISQLNWLDLPVPRLAVQYVQQPRGKLYPQGPNPHWVLLRD